MVVEYMDGGGGRKAANFMFRSARPDGLAMMASSGGMVAASILGESGVMYDIDKFIYLGAPKGSSHQVIYARKELGLGPAGNGLPRPQPGLRIGARVGGSCFLCRRPAFCVLPGFQGT